MAFEGARGERGTDSATRAEAGDAGGARVDARVAAQAAMNFCAAPAMQTSERTNADPGVKALVKKVQSH